MGGKKPERCPCPKIYRSASQLQLFLAMSLKFSPRLPIICESHIAGDMSRQGRTHRRGIGAEPFPRRTCRVHQRQPPARRQEEVLRHRLPQVSRRDAPRLPRTTTGDGAFSLFGTETRGAVRVSMMMEEPRDDKRRTTVYITQLRSCSPQQIQALPRQPMHNYKETEP